MPIASQLRALFIERLRQRFDPANLPRFVARRLAYWSVLHLLSFPPAAAGRESAQCALDFVVKPAPLTAAAVKPVKAEI